MYFFVGSYTETGSPAADPKGAGISCCWFDPQDGSINILGNTFQRSPSYPVVSSDGSTLYAAEEMYSNHQTRLIAYRILANGSLQKINEVPLNGDYACHLAIASQTIIVANYLSSDILVYELEEDGRLGTLKQHIQHCGSGMHKERQEAPHPHMIFPVSAAMVYCVDLGIDRLKAYLVDPITKMWAPATQWDISVKQGIGARHMDIGLNGENMVVLGELTGELLLYRRNGHSFKQQDKTPATAEMTSAAAVRIHANNRFVYFSERNTNSIYAFEIRSSGLETIGAFSSEGKTPRDIAIDPTGKWLLAANQDSDSLAVFSINPATGGLKISHTCKVYTPACICWQFQSHYDINGCR